MAVNVIAHDARLEGRTPLAVGSTVTVDVDDETLLSDFIDRAVRISEEHEGIDVLYIMAHGVYVVTDDTSAIMFCRDFISYQTVHEFSRLRDKVDRIVLFVCHAAETTMTRHGDGDELCRQLALIANAEVTAAREDQSFSRVEECRLMFCDESSIEFGDWEGPVVVYGRDGNIISEFQNPSVGPLADGFSADPRSAAP